MSQANRPLESILSEASDAWSRLPTREATQDDPQEAKEERESIVPERFRGASLASPEWLGRIASGGAKTSSLVASIKPQRNAVVLGPSGSGKSTTLAIALADVWKRARWVKHRELQTLARYSPFKDGFPTVLERYQTCPLLVVDNLDVTVQGDALELVLEERYDRNLITWTSSADSVDEIHARWPNTCARRIFHDAVVINLGDGTK